MLDYLSKNYKSLALIGIAILIVGVLIYVGDILAPGRIIAISGSMIYTLGIGITSISLTGGAILDEEQNQYVRLGMLIATGLLLSYGLTYLTFIK